MAKHKKRKAKPSKRKAKRSESFKQVSEPIAPVNQPVDTVDDEPVAPAAHRWIARAVVAVAAALAFARGLPHGLLGGWDDDRFLTQNELVQSVSLDHFVAIFTQPHFQAYHPFHLLSYWIDVPWFGLDGPAIHCVSLVLWVLALLALLEAAWSLRLGLVAGVVLVLVVGLHPVQVEAVTWATGRKDILALGFSALAIVSYARSKQPFDRYAFLFLIAYAAACFSKTTAIVLPAVMLLADYWLLERPWRRSVLALAPTLLFGLILGGITIAIWNEADMIRARELDVIGRLSLVGSSLTHALSTLVWPDEVSPLYAIERGGDFGLAASLLGGLLVGLAFAISVVQKHRRVAFGLATFVVFWLPASNVIPLYFQWQDRYLSLPVFGLAFALAALIPRNIAFKRIAWLPVALGLALGLRTSDYIGVWRDDLTLFGHAASTQPQSFYAWLNLGHARRNAGEYEAAITAYSSGIEAADLTLGHAARFRAVLLQDEMRYELSPSRADRATREFMAALESSGHMRTVAGELGNHGYRRGVTTALGYAFAQNLPTDDALESAAVVQLERGHPWLTDFYLSYLQRTPVTPLLVERINERTESPP